MNIFYFNLVRFNFIKRTLFPGKYPEFNQRFNELCKFDQNKKPTELNMFEIDEICSSYARIVEVFPDLAEYDFRYNKNM